jgi:hypothetical protein
MAGKGVVGLLTGKKLAHNLFSGFILWQRGGDEVF